MRMHIFLDSGSLGCILNDLENHHPCHFSSSAIEKQRVFTFRDPGEVPAFSKCCTGQGSGRGFQASLPCKVLGMLETSPSFRNIALHGIYGIFPHRHQTLLVTLSGDSDELFIEKQV